MNTTFPGTVYDKNETMRLLGLQVIETAEDNQSREKQLTDVMRAYRLQSIAEEQPLDIIGMLRSAYNLGKIQGIKQERAKRK